MKRTRTDAWVPACALLLLFSACGGKKEAPKAAPGGGPGGERAAENPAPTVAAPKAQPHIDAFRLGFAFGPDGQVRGEGNTFAKGEKVFLSFGIRDAKPGSSTRVVWVKNPAGTKLSEETKALPPDPGTLGFVADTAGWSAGEYGVEIWVVEPSAEPRRLGAAGLTVSSGRQR
jgi:hypothetical protein